MTFEAPPSPVRPARAKAPTSLSLSLSLPLNPFQAGWIDLLRGTAAQLVVIEHVLALTHPDRSPRALSHFGVAVFFLLSGFLITQTILERHAAGRFSLGEFLASRFARIFAPLLPAVALVAVVDAAMLSWPRYVWQADYNPATAIANVLMLQDYPLFQVLRRLGVPEQWWFFGPFGSARPFWTISIEWWIYVVVGIGASLAITGRLRLAALLVLPVAIIPFAYHAIGGPGNGLTAMWLFGGLLALARRSGTLRARLLANTPRARMLVLPAVLAVATLAFGRLVFTRGQVYDLIFIMLAGCVMFAPVFAAEWSRGQLPAWLKPLRGLAFHSYSLYLIHLSLVVLLVGLLEDRVAAPALAVLLVLASNLAAWPFALLFEQRHRVLRAWLLERLGRADPAGPGVRR